MDGSAQINYKFNNDQDYNTLLIMSKKISQTKKRKKDKKSMPLILLQERNQVKISKHKMLKGMLLLIRQCNFNQTKQYRSLFALI